MDSEQHRSVDEGVVEIESRDYWFKIVDFLQQNWALIDAHEAGAIVRFFGDTAGVFDEMVFQSVDAAEQALLHNGFRRFIDDAQAAKFIAVPHAPFRRRPHPNGPIYSSGRYCK